MNGFTSVRKKSRRKPLADEYDETSPAFLAKFSRRLDSVLEQFETEPQLTATMGALEKAFSFLGSNYKILNIICYGLGSPSNSKTSTFQLALAFKLSRRLNCPLSCYDPVFTSVDQKVFETIDCSVLPQDDKGCRRLDVNTLFFLPHCPRFVFNNILKVNWGEDLSKCVVLGDNLLSVIEQSPSRIFRAKHPILYRCRTFVDVVPVENCFKYKDVFNDFAVHFFTSAKLAQVEADL